MSVRVLLADDHPIVRQGLRHLLEEDANVTIVGEAGDGLQAVQLVDSLKPDILILDMMMPHVNGLEVLRQVKVRSPATRSIILSMQSADIYVVQALKAGALGYVVKETGPSELLTAIRQVVAGQRYLSPSLSDRLIDVLLSAAEASSTDPYESLTSREREILQMSAEGLSTAEIAQRLTISPRTAELHRARMMNKLGLRNQTDVVRFALKQGVLAMEI